MTLHKEDILVLEELIRKVIREELSVIVHESSDASGVAGDEEFRAAAAKVFKKHKKVLDALA